MKNLDIKFSQQMYIQLGFMKLLQHVLVQAFKRSILSLSVIQDIFLDFAEEGANS